VPLGDAITTAQNFVNVLFYVYLALILVYILMSWIPLPYTIWLNRTQRFLYDVVEPYLRVFRRVLPSFSLGGLGLDLSPIVAVIVLIVLRELVVEGIGLLR
jgi:YggT family protein